MRTTSVVQPFSTVALLFQALLLSIGALFVFEASGAESLQTFGNQYSILQRHLIGLVLGAVAFCIGFIMPSKFWIKTGPALYWGSIVLLVAVFVPGLGLNLNGASRWIVIAGQVLQPVEILKFALVAFFSFWLSKHQRVIPFVFLTALPCLLLILQPDLGSLLLVGGTACTLYFVAGGSLKQLGGLAAVAIPILMLLIVGSEYRFRRLMTFVNPESDPLGASFHIRQITLALGRGGILGQGLGNSKQKYSYIPEASTDSIFAIVGEELGFVGALIICGLFLVFTLSSLKAIAATQHATELKLLGYGCCIWITTQILLNLSAVVALVPLTGVPLPFFSYGRTAQVMILFATGVLQRLARSK